MAELVAVAQSGSAFVDTLTRVWANGDAVLPVDLRLPPPGVARLLDILQPAWVIDASGHDHRRDGRPVDPGDALVVATSGTTGIPKGVVLTHDAVSASAHASSSALGVDPEHDLWLACLPLAHVGGLSVVTRALITGTPLAVMDGFDATSLEALAREARSAGRRALVSLVATALARIDPTLFRRIILGGGPAPNRPPNAVVSYGLTETGSGVVYDGLPLNGIEVRLDAGGQIYLRGAPIGRAYRHADGDTLLTDDDGWLATGDEGVLDLGGRLVVLGRRGEVIVTGGEKVWPAAVEQVLREHPGIAHLAVTGLADPEWGERVVAVVVPTDRSAPPTLDELRAVAKRSLPAWAAPRQLVLADSLPTTALGKVVRERLVTLVERAADQK